MAANFKPLNAWAIRENVPHKDARRLHELLTLRHDQGVRVCNGDPHPKVKNNGDKNANSDAWSKEEDITIKKIDDICARIGLTYDPGTGLWGSFKRNGSYIGDLPDCNEDDE